MNENEVLLNFGDVEEAKSDRSAMFPVGPNEAEIADVTLKKTKSEKESAYIAVTIVNPEKTQMNEEKFFVSSPEALEVTKSRIKHLIHYAVNEAASLKTYSLPELKKLLVGKKLRLNFVGREYMGNDGEIKMATQLDFQGFAESLDIPIEKSGLYKKAIKKYKGIGSADKTSPDQLSESINELKFD